MVFPEKLPCRDFFTKVASVRHCFCIFILAMRKILITALISIHLFGNTELAQLCKLPNLLQHYFEHSRINPHLSFSEFLFMHYGGDDGTTADDDFDSKLPCHNTQGNTLALVYSPMVSELPVIRYIPALSKEYNSPLEPGTSTEHVLMVLQPPRFFLL